MKNILNIKSGIILLFFALLVSSCMIKERRAEANWKLSDYIDEVSKTTLFYPVQTLDCALKLNDYLLASDEDKNSLKFAGFKDAISMLGDTIVWKGYGSFYTGGMDLKQKGTEWKVKCGNYDTYMSLSKNNDIMEWVTSYIRKGFSHFGDKINFESKMTLVGNVLSENYMNGWTVSSRAQTEGYSGVKADYRANSVRVYWVYTFSSISDEVISRQIGADGYAKMETMSGSKVLDTIEFRLDNSRVNADFRYGGTIGALYNY